MDHAASLSGQARNDAYAKLDLTIMKNYAPWVLVHQPQRRVLRRVHDVNNYVYSTYFTEPDYNALAVE